MPLRLRKLPAALSPARAPRKQAVRRTRKPAPPVLPVAASAVYRLPLPPTANNLFPTVTANGRARRVKSREYRRWLAQAGEAARKAGLCRVPSPVAVAVVVEGGRGFNRGRDCDNTLKPILDLLAALGCIGGDSVCHVVDVRATYRRVAGESGCVVTVAAEGQP